MQIEGYEFPDDLFYDNEHFYARVEGRTVTVGITSYAEDMAGEIIYIELPEVGRKTVQGQPLTSMESGKWVGRIFAPVSGTVLKINEELEDDASLINQDPYGNGWMYAIEAGDGLEDELKNLMRAGEELEAFIRSEKEKHRKD